MKPSNRRIRNGQIVTLIDPKDYVLVRHPSCVPFFVTRKEWDSLPLAPKPKKESK